MCECCNDKIEDGPGINHINSMLCAVYHYTSADKYIYHHGTAYVWACQKFMLNAPTQYKAWFQPIEGALLDVLRATPSQYLKISLPQRIHGTF